MILETMKFDVLLNADKNTDSAAFSIGVRAEEKRGFGLHPNGCIIPFNAEADYNYRMGLDDQLKFKENQRTGLDILAETWNLGYTKDEYVLILSETEKQRCDDMRRQYAIKEGEVCLGLNTGCSTTFPLKKLPVPHLISLIHRILDGSEGTRILLLGGKEDTDRNAEIERSVGREVIVTPTTEGLRDGMLSVNLCDIVISGDTLGMHIAIALKKSVIAWFSISCAAEIELFGRGKKIITSLDCSPCWKRSCEDPVCVDQPDLDMIFEAAVDEIQKVKKAQGK
jgi:heptosyltransferase-2